MNKMDNKNKVITSNNLKFELKKLKIVIMFNVPKDMYLMYNIQVYIMVDFVVINVEVKEM